MRHASFFIPNFIPLQQEMKKQFFVFILFMAVLYGSAQSKTIDSLKQVLKGIPAGHDTSRISVLYKLGYSYQKKNLDSAIYYHLQAFELATKIKDALWQGEVLCEMGWEQNLKGEHEKATDLFRRALRHAHAVQATTQDTAYRRRARKLEGLALGNLGIVHKNQSKLPEALAFFAEALKISEELGNARMQNSHVTGIGNVYLRQANYPEALKFFFRAVRLSEESGNKKMLAGDYGSVGNVYASQKNYSQALVYYHKAVKAAEDARDARVMASNYANIGVIYAGQGDSAAAKGNKAFALEKKYPLALEYFFKTMKMAEESNNKILLSNIYSNISAIYAHLEKYREALEYNNKALQLAEEMGNRNGIASELCNIGIVYTNLKNYTEAERYILRSLEVAEEAGLPDELQVAHLCLSELYEKTNRAGAALEHYKLYVIYRDSIFNEENTKNSVRAEMNFEFERKQSAEKAEREKKEAVAAAEREKEKQQQKFVLGSVLAGLLLVSVFSVFLFRAYRQKNKANQVITQQKKEVELQKQMVEQKQKEMLDSIRYARRIQRALITNESYIGRALKRMKG